MTTENILFLHYAFWSIKSLKILFLLTDYWSYQHGELETTEKAREYLVNTLITAIVYPSTNKYPFTPFLLHGGSSH